MLYSIALYSKLSYTISREFLCLARARAGWGKGKDSPKNSPAQAGAGRKGKGVWGKGIPAPPERIFSEIDIGIFPKKGSNFNQKTQLIKKSPYILQVGRFFGRMKG